MRHPTRPTNADSTGQNALTAGQATTGQALSAGQLSLTVTQAGPRVLPVAQNDDEEVTEDDDIESEDFGLGVAMVMSTWSR